MSIDQTRRSLNQLDKEIVDLEKKLSDEVKKEADKTKRINDTNKSITKNTSSSMLNSKLRQIQRYQDELVKISDNKSDINKKIADKKKRRADMAVRLQKEEQEEVKKQQKAQLAIYSDYEKRIADLASQLNNQIPKIEKNSIPTLEGQDELYDVFISHAWEDKESFVDEFVDALTALKVKVWYDKNKISWGDSMREKIDMGLKKSRFGIAIISSNYIAEGKYWTKKELDGLFQLESINGKRLLPIWHNITKKEVMDYSPIIAGKKAITTALMTPEEIAYELHNLLNTNIMEDEINGQT
ncbi:MAG TPA: hypothetical protein DIV40_02590 [Clostridiales bacterium]|jgi:hypothetical protein|nr:hypothetical protein [Clostridiales bacterium]